jgi:hypothetical protein
MRKCINSHSKANFSLVEFPAIRESLKKRNLLINVRTANITVIQSLYAISRRGMISVRKIIQPCNIIIEPVELVRVANTLHASIILEAMQRTIKNATNSKSFYKNSIEIVLEPTSRTYQTP